MNETLMTLIVQNLAFLELSGDDIVNPDAAVRETEQIASELSELDEEDKKHFISFVERYAQKEATAGQPKKRVEFIRTIPVSLGLVDEDDV